MNAQGELWEELRVESSWYHILRSMVLDGTMRQLEGTAWMVYCAMKAHTNYKTGEVFASQERLADICGCSIDSVQRAQRRLMEQGVITKEKHGRKNIYQLIETVAVTEKGGDRAVLGRATRTYAPEAFHDFLKELKAFAESGELPKDKAIQFNFNINLIQQGDNSTVTINNVTVGDAAVDPMLLTDGIGAYPALAARLRLLK